MEGCVLADQIKSLDWRVRHATRISTVPAAVLDETLARIFSLLDPGEVR